MAPNIKYVIVVMLENRSYDNILGWLYNPNNAPPFQYPPAGQSNLNGLCCNNVNPNPAGGTPILAENQTDATIIGGTSYPPTTNPVYDPGEWFGDMAQQITGSALIPKSNPYEDYTPQASGLMQGFTTNYLSPVPASYPWTLPPPAGTSAQAVMNYFTPAQLPVTSFLANNFGVCDQWFASVPTQTYANRTFALCAAPGMGTIPNVPGTVSWVNDYWYIQGFVGGDGTLTGPALSVLQQLDAMNPAGNGKANWKVYFHDYSIAYETVLYVQSQSANDPNINVATFDTTDWGTTRPHQLTQPTGNTFLEDLAASPCSLPPLSFIEPRYFMGYPQDKNASTPYAAPNSNHPGGASYPPLPPTNVTPPIDVLSGELFLMQVYNALQANPSVWNETLLIVTYDEHGGLYDHVPPPLATPPGQLNTSPNATTIPAAQDPDDPAANNFNFNVLGGRVPAIIVSPYVTQGSTIRDPGGAPFDHTSIVKTLWDIFALGSSPASLTGRDAAAPSLVPLLSDTAVNTTGAFSGLIVAGPSFLVFSQPSPTQPQTVVVSAGGSIELTATSQTDWLSVSPALPATGETLTLAVSIDASNVPSSSGTYNGSITIAGSNVTSLEIPVTLVVSLNE